MSYDEKDKIMKVELGEKTFTGLPALLLAIPFLIVVGIIIVITLIFLAALFIVLSPAIILFCIIVMIADKVMSYK